jgi:hypothetical protein
MTAMNPRKLPANADFDTVKWYVLTDFFDNVLMHLFELLLCLEMWKWELSMFFYVAVEVWPFYQKCSVLYALSCISAMWTFYTCLLSCWKWEKVYGDVMECSCCI